MRNDSSGAASAYSSISHSGRASSLPAAQAVEKSPGCGVSGAPVACSGDHGRYGLSGAAVALVPTAAVVLEPATSASGVAGASGRGLPGARPCECTPMVLTKRKEILRSFIVLNFFDEVGDAEVERLDGSLIAVWTRGSTAGSE